MLDSIEHFVAQQYHDWKKSEHKANQHMSAQLAAAPTYAQDHGRPTNVWADWGQAVGHHVQRADNALVGLIPEGKIMNPVQAAIRRILAQHYGGNWNDPRAQAWGSRLTQAPPVSAAQAAPFRQWLQTQILQ